MTTETLPEVAPEAAPAAETYALTRVRFNLAMAVRLWQGWMQSEGDRSWPDAAALDAADEALAMSKAAGCLAEYLASLSTVPVMKVAVENLDLPAKPKRRPFGTPGKARKAVRA